MEATPCRIKKSLVGAAELLWAFQLIVMCIVIHGTSLWELIDKLMYEKDEKREALNKDANNWN